MVLLFSIAFAFLAASLMAALLLLYLILRKERWQEQYIFSKRSLHSTLSLVRQQTEARRYLSRLIGIDEDALPPMGGWAASADFLILVAEQVLSAKPSRVVEFGSGMTTLIVAQCLRLNGTGELITVEHDQVYANIVRERADKLQLKTDIRIVELLAAEALGYQGKWYDTRWVEGPVDLLIVDGPPASIHRETRGGAGSLFGKLSSGGMLLLDDAERPGERAIVEQWRRQTPDMSFSYIDTEKGTVLGVRR